MASVQQMDFLPEETIRGAVRRALTEHDQLIRILIPSSEVQHVGSTSVPGCLTKGDLDILVSVPAAAFDEASAVLGERYAIHQPENWSTTFASFKREPPGAIPVGVQLVVRGSQDERLFLEWRDRLKNDPQLLSEYNRLKKSQLGASPRDSAAEKARFIESNLTS